MCAHIIIVVDGKDLPATINISATIEVTSPNQGAIIDCVNKVGIWISMFYFIINCTIINNIFIIINNY